MTAQRVREPSQPNGPPGIAELFAVLGSEDEAIALLDTGLSKLRQVQQAKTLLGRLPFGEVHDALAQRQAALGVVCIAGKTP